MRTIDNYPLKNPFNDLTTGRIIAWWSGGVASAVACYLTLRHYRDHQISIVFCDTHQEHPDTYRFMEDFKRILGVDIECIESEVYHDPEAVWDRYTGLNFATGAPCSSELKRTPRIKYQDTGNDFAQIFGFDDCPKEHRRARSMLLNNPDLNPVFPLIAEGYDRSKIFACLKHLGIKHPKTYQHFLNNNCIGADDSPKGGCVQGGIGYWQKMKDIYPKKYAWMAKKEHELSRIKGKPVTICRDQRGGTKKPLFLSFCVDFPDVETVDVIKGRRPVTVFECNGFCGTMSNE